MWEWKELECLGLVALSLTNLQRIGEARTVSSPGDGRLCSWGGRRARLLYPPPPPPSLEIGTEVPDHRRQRHPKANLLEPLRGQKMGFHPMCLYAKYSVFSGQPNDG